METNDASTIGKPRKMDERETEYGEKCEAVFQKTGGAMAETDAGQATRKNEEKGEAENRKTEKNEGADF